MSAQEGRLFADITRAGVGEILSPRLMPLVEIEPLIPCFIIGFVQCLSESHSIGSSHLRLLEIAKLGKCHAQYI